MFSSNTDPFGINVNDGFNRFIERQWMQAHRLWFWHNFLRNGKRFARHNQREVWRICPAEGVASEASSASCYHPVKDVWILPVVEAEGKLI